jgi:hypothetical protein
VVVDRGKFTASYRKLDENALLQHEARVHRAGLPEW